MSNYVLSFSVTIPAGTPIATPYIQALPMDSWEVESVDLMVPPGPWGNMGFALYRSGTQAIPWNGTTWIVWDDREENWVLDDLPTSQGWQVVGYNLGVYPHAVTIRFHVNVIPSASPPLPVLTVVSSPPPPPTAGVDSFPALLAYTPGGEPAVTDGTQETADATTAALMAIIGANDGAPLG